MTSDLVFERRWLRHYSFVCSEEEEEEEEVLGTILFLFFQPSFFG